MKKAYSLVVTTFCASLLLTGCMNLSNSPSQPINTTPSPAPSQSQSENRNPDDPSFLLAEYEEDLNGDSSKEKIALYAHETNDMPTSWTLNIEGVEAVTLDLAEGIYGQAGVQLEDINGDQKPEVLFYRYNTGSGGAQGLNIYRVSDNKLEALFSIDDPNEGLQDRFDMKYLGDFRVSFEDRKTGLAQTIPLHKENYQEVEEQLLEGISTWVDPISQYEIQDNNNDGIKEMVAVRRVIGVAHVDTIGTLKTTYTLSQGQYKAVEQALYDSKDALLKKVILP